MSVDKAKDFLTYLMDNPDVAEKMKGFTHGELKQAAEMLKDSGDLPDEYEDHNHITP